MKKLFKVLFYLVIVLVVLVIGAVGLVYLYFDPNDYKEQMASAVKDQTGRELTIGGEIGLTFFPWIAVEMKDVSLGNAQGFEEPVFAGVETMRVSIKLLPLIKQEVEMDTVTLHGLRVNLARNAAGKTNWEDLTAGKPQEKQDPAGAPPIAALAIGGLDVKDARIQWRDAESGQHYELADLYLTTGAIELGEPVDVDFGFRLTGEQPQMTADIRLQTDLTLDIEAQRYDADGLRLTVTASGDGLPVAELEAVLTSDVAVDIAAQTADVRNLKLSALGLDASGELKATRIVDAPAYTGTLSLAEMNLRDLLAELDTPPVETADPEVLKAISMSTRIDGTADEVKLEDFNLKLDDSTLTGNLGVANFGQPAIRFDLQMDAIDADRYLPPAAEAGDASASSGEGGGGAAGSGAPPAQAAALAPLRTLDAAGNLRIGRLVINKLTLTDILVRLDGKNGLVKLDPISAELYEGLFKGQVTLDARKDVPRLAVKKSLKGIQAGPLLRDLTGKKELLTGTGQVNVDVTLAGMDPDTIKRTLEGTADFAFLEGTVKGINIGRLIREARARLAGKTLPPDDQEKQTDFSELTGSVRITDGIVTNDDLYAKSPLLRINGKGMANLLAEEIDYLLTTTIVGTLKGQGGKELEELQGVPIPVRVGGTFQKPSFKPDLGEVLKSKATQEIKKKAEEKVKEKLGDKLKDKLGGEKGQELLKGLFN
ncbi:MAG: AsmA family protein [Gammaproteobacteria bacterium]|nr:AsmA family protein [Gammaproteobacteria bacterium]